jgi:hypothetical protein
VKVFRKGLGARAVAAGATFAGAVAILGVSTAWALGTLAGPAQVVNSGGVSQLNAGGSNTAFQLRLPGQSHCSGDTATGGYNVYSYIVPVGTDPGTLTFDSANGPNNNPNAFPLVDTFGTPYNAANTAPNTGAIYPSGAPTFNFAVFSTTQLPPGTYNIGLECATKTGAADVYFNNKINIIADATDPNGFRFTVVPPNLVPESPLTVALPLSAVAVLGIGGYLVIRRRRQTVVPSA